MGRDDATSQLAPPGGLDSLRNELGIEWAVAIPTLGAQDQQLRPEGVPGTYTLSIADGVLFTVDGQTGMGAGRPFMITVEDQ